MTVPQQLPPGFLGVMDGNLLDKVLAYLQLAYVGSVVAKASGSVSNSTPIIETFTQIDTVASTNDGVLLPAAIPGRFFVLTNAGANDMKVFAAGGSTINATAGATGLAQASGLSALYFCAKLGRWNRLLSA